MAPDDWQLVKDLYREALEVESAARSAFLEIRCGGKAQVLREVESLIAAHFAETAFLERPAIELAASGLAGTSGPLALGQLVGRYEVKSLLGTGGMGEVYLAFDARLGRKVALKLLPTELAQDTERKARFEREARAASALNHPNVCVIHEIGELDDGRQYIAMEHIDGDTLRRRLSNGNVDVGRALDIVTQVALALTVAHEAGIVHRDIKPENIMVRSDGIVKMVDFGLAKHTRFRRVVESGIEDGQTERNPQRSTVAPDRVPTVDESSDSSPTGSGALVGTLPYMSPEQLRGLPADRRSDLFSLGVVLYESIARRPPFAGATSVDLIASILYEDPAPLAPHAVDVSFALEKLVRQCLAKQPDLRYQSAQELLHDLRILATQRSQPQSAAQRTPSVAVLAFDNLSADPENEFFCDGLAEELLNTLAKIKSLRVAARSSAFYFKDKNASVREVGERLDVEVLVQGSVRRSGNRVRITVQLVSAANGYHLWSERYDREIDDIFDVQDEISLAIVDALKVKLLGVEKAAVTKRYTENAEAYQLYLRGRYFWYRFPERGYEKARVYFQQSIDADPTYALGYCGLADDFGMAAALGLMPPDEGWSKCVAAMNTALTLDDALADVYNTLAGVSIYYYRDWPAAERAFQQAIELNPNFAEAHHHYALCLACYGRSEEALASVGRGLQLDPLSLHRNLWKGRVLFWFGRYEEAIEQYLRTLDLDGNSSLAHKWLGDAYEQCVCPDDAVRAWSRALDLQGRRKFAALLDRTFKASGFDEAVRVLTVRRLDRLREKERGGAYVPAMAYVTLYVRLGDLEKSAAWLAKAVNERNRSVLEICVDPSYASIRNAPEFAALASQMGFPSR